MKSKQVHPYIMFLSLFLIGCTSSIDSEIEPQLQAHLDSFRQEAEARGVTLDVNNLHLDGYIDNIAENGTLGQCKSYSDGSKVMVIDTYFWDSASTLEREYVVFHELGHCLLGRSHTDAKDENGFCASIMQSGNTVCKGKYTESNRSDLLDELFNN